MAELRAHYDPQRYIDEDPDLAAVMRMLESAQFNSVEPGIFDGIIETLKSPHDPWMTLADFRSYIDAQARAEAVWRDQQAWRRMSILNTAASGVFSTDRTISEYNEDIWKLEPMTPSGK